MMYDGEKMDTSDLKISDIKTADCPHDYALLENVLTCRLCNSLVELKPEPTPGKVVIHNSSSKSSSSSSSKSSSSCSSGSSKFSSSCSYSSSSSSSSSSMSGSTMSECPDDEHDYYLEEKFQTLRCRKCKFNSGLDAKLQSPEPEKKISVDETGCKNDQHAYYDDNGILKCRNCPHIIKDTVALPTSNITKLFCRHVYDSHGVCRLCYATTTLIPDKCVHVFRNGLCVKCKLVESADDLCSKGIRDRTGEIIDNYVSDHTDPCQHFFNAYNKCVKCEMSKHVAQFLGHNEKQGMSYAKFVKIAEQASEEMCETYEMHDPTTVFCKKCNYSTIV